MQASSHDSVDNLRRSRRKNFDESPIVQEPQTCWKDGAEKSNQPQTYAHSFHKI